MLTLLVLRDRQEDFINIVLFPLKSTAEVVFACAADLVLRRVGICGGLVGDLWELANIKDPISLDSWKVKSKKIGLD